MLPAPRLQCLFLIINLFFIIEVRAQTLPVGTPLLEDYYRRAQIQGKLDSNVSFAIRPLFIKNSLKYNYSPSFYADSTDEDRWIKSQPLKFAKGNGLIEILPVSWSQQYNSDFPYGWNDGAKIPSRGYQSIISAGIYVRWGPLSVQIKPEYVYASNKPFNGFAESQRTDTDLENYFKYHNDIDNPQRFGTDTYKRLFLGQSSIRITIDPVSIGLSNENIWWGPGLQNALVLSNNAPGFKHFTLNTVRPIHTLVGSFEFQAIAGRLENTTFKPISQSTTSSGKELFWPRRDDWRYLTGFNANYHPRWIDGFTVGLTRTFNSYGADLKTLSDYIPFFFPYRKVNTNNGDPIARDQYTSLYARWVFKKALAEIYYEYGLNDNSYTYRDFIGSPEHSRAYIFGIRKLMSLNKFRNQFIMFDAEITQTSQAPDRLVRDAFAWYSHFQIRQGHTNIGQVLGAGTGPGGNLQHFGISWLSGIKKLGLTFDRFEHNVDFSDAFFTDINGQSRKWVDMVFGIQADWNYRNLLLNAKLQHVTSLNYQWLTKAFNADNSYYIPQNTATNLHSQLSVAYRF